MSYAYVYNLCFCNIFNIPERIAVPRFVSWCFILYSIMLFVIILFLIWKFMSTAHCVFAMFAHSEVMKGISRP